MGCVHLNIFKELPASHIWLMREIWYSYADQMLSVSHSLRCTVYNIKIICQSGYQVLAASFQKQIEQNLQRQKGVAIFCWVWGAFELKALGSTENAILCPQYDAL
jgi:hypothetical protein